MHEPLFILTPNPSLCAAARVMLGSHPEMFALLETNLFLADTYQTLQHLDPPDHAFASALVETLAELAYGQPTDANIGLVEDWLNDYPVLSTVDLFGDMQALAEPLRLIEASALYTFIDGVIARLTDAFPKACYLHLSMHPRLTCELAYHTSGAAPDDAAGKPASVATIHPNTIWYRPHMRILDSLASVAPVQKMFMRGEQLLSDPQGSLEMIGNWLGIGTDDEVLASMLGPQTSRPAGRVLPHTSPALDQLTGSMHTCTSDQDDLMGLDGPLSWDEDLVFDESLKRLAALFGY